MKRNILKSKIHRAVVTEMDIDYEGSLIVDESLLKAADMVPFEQVHVYNITNGERFVTHIIKGEKDSGMIGVNGAAVHKASSGDVLIIAAYTLMDDEESSFFCPKVVLVDKNNKIKK
ncbi:MAG: aspartate 1-decarboxylase [Candidatus Aminicenantes bacterium]|nr:MAG: aspartate 1-decarboxylase [Candidatus Aminicenantes bacterium]